MSDQESTGRPESLATVEFIVPGHPPTVNHIWKTFGTRRFKSTAYLEWEAKTTKVVLVHPYKSKFRDLDGRMYRLLITMVRNSWLNKKKTAPLLPDTPNCIKAAEDAICAVTGWDDRFNIETTIKKVEESGAEDYTTVIFEFV